MKKTTDEEKTEHREWYVEKESERQIIDWDRTYFLTKYYSI
ncbi:MAG: hypothetical protein ABTB30_15725 [Clostridia bacterium]